MQEGNNAFLTISGNQTDVLKADSLFFDLNQKALYFARENKPLIFKISPAGDYKRRVNFIKKDRDFKQFCQIISQLRGLRGEMHEESCTSYCQWDFVLVESPPIILDDDDYIYLNFGESISQLSIFKPRNGKVLLLANLYFIDNEIEFFELASFIGAMNNFKCQEMHFPRDAKRIGYRFISP